MALRSFKLDPFHVHTYVIVKDVEIVKVISEDLKVEDTLGTSIKTELIKTGKPE